MQDLLRAWGAPLTARDGSATVPVLRIGARNYDFWAEPLVGYERRNLGEIGTLLLVTERAEASQASLTPASLTRTTSR